MNGFWNLAREKCCRTEEHCVRKNVTLLEMKRRWMKIISWEDGEDKKERHMEVDRETEEEMGKEDKRRGERGERDGDF